MKTKRLIYGVGINNADYIVEKREIIGYEDGKQKRKLVWICPYFRVWRGMLERCYSEKWQEKYPTYRGCSVSTEWLTFSVFKSWMMTQDWEGLQLDKDLLVQGNKIYSADTCVFVTQTVNKFINDRGNDRGEWLLGVNLYKRTGMFQARCCNHFSKKREFLGYFTSEQEAHQAWKKRKLELAHEIAAIQTDQRVAEALINRYS
jgi:hypothetical protein